MSVIKFFCAGCGSKIVMGRSFRGKRVKCNRCGRILTVPTIDGVRFVPEIPTSRTSNGAASTIKKREREVRPVRRVLPPLGQLKWPVGLALILGVTALFYFVINKSNAKTTPIPIAEKTLQPMSNTFSVIKVTSDPPDSREINVRLKGSVSTNALIGIAKEIIAAYPANVNTTAIAYYRPHDVIGENPFCAYTEFHGESKLDTLINDGAQEQVSNPLDIPVKSDPANIGIWVDFKGEVSPCKVRMYKQDGDVYLEESFCGGGCNADRIIKKEDGWHWAWAHEPQGQARDHLIITPAGDLEFWGVTGLDRTATRVEK